ncbi:hypothetical protein E3N88_10856 [Mikania micrantha]|uniref:Reverse transcriptase domain-containing protein n=1 Tax=Mikania micrantha TaxID=192012 RepID=A0A5N6PBX9_9ASTR|nr:hypothetical protein E3N88_10856 [Mikania micrantha]
MPGRSTTEAVHILRRLMEKYREKRKDLHMVFIDLEKAYDSVPRQVIWDSLESRGIPQRYIEVIKDTYAAAETSVRAPVGDTDFFPVEVGLHQGSALSPFFFAVILDELSRYIQAHIPWCMLFADDIVLVAETKEELNVRLEEWRTALEQRGLCISRTKTEYLHCQFCGANEEDKDDHVTIGGQEVPRTTKFKYLGSFIQGDGDIDSDIAHRVQAGWKKWRAATSIICDKKFPEKLKGKFYRAAIRPAMMYGTDCWPIKKNQARKLETAEMRMLRWMCGHTRLDRIRNEVFRERLQVANISNKVREGRLRWFGHVRRRSQSAPVRKVELLIVEGKRGRGRPRLTWDEQIRQDLTELHLSEDMIYDRRFDKPILRLSTVVTPLKIPPHRNFLPRHHPTENLKTPQWSPHRKTSPFVREAAGCVRGVERGAVPAQPTNSFPPGEGGGVPSGARHPAKASGLTAVHGLMT